MRDYRAQSSPVASSSRPAVFSVPLTSAGLPEVRSSQLLDRPPQVTSISAIIAPDVLSLPVQTAPVRAQSFQFAPPTKTLISFLSTSQESSVQSISRDALLEAARLLRTRIQPPDDVIKLEDRLHFVLQPSLETLIVRQALEFPLAPFPFQLQGVAFLYPRISALLADEMGLGKTMQAITALRMLLRAGRFTACCWCVPSRWSRVGSASFPYGRRNCRWR